MSQTRTASSPCPTQLCLFCQELSVRAGVLLKLLLLKLVVVCRSGGRRFYVRTRVSDDGLLACDLGWGEVEMVEVWEGTEDGSQAGQDTLCS